MSEQSKILKSADKEFSFSIVRSALWLDNPECPACNTKEVPDLIMQIEEPELKCGFFRCSSCEQVILSPSTSMYTMHLPVTGRWRAKPETIEVM